MRWIVVVGVVALGCSYPDYPPCPLALSYSELPSGAGTAADLGSAEGLPDSWAWEGRLSGAGANLLTVGVQIYSGGGSSTPDWPTLSFTHKVGIDLASSLDAVVFVGEGPTSLFTEFYLAAAGTLNISQVTPVFAGNASDLVLQHVDDTANGEVGDPDMCTTTIPAFSFAVPTP